MPRKVCRQPAVTGLLLLFFCLALYQMHIANVRIPISKGLDITRLPKEYERPNTQPEYCEARFGKNYLHAFENGSASYCDTESSSQLTCFSNNIDPDNVKSDSFCIGGPTVFTPQDQRFLLQCNIRSLSPEEIKSGAVPISEFTIYPYQTGPLYIFDQYVKPTADENQKLPVKDAKAPTAILVKREEAQHNPWNGLMEIMSTYMTLDVLRMTVNPATGTHYYSSSEFDNTQVIILDGMPEGPYFDLWHLFARKPIIHLSNLTSLSTPTQYKNIIIPLAGGSNPFTLSTMSAIDPITTCKNSTLLRVFSSRVLYAYNIATSSTRLQATSPSTKAPLKLTFINRLSSRRLLNQNKLLSLLHMSYAPSVLVIHVMEYSILPFPQQLSITHDHTDILIGVSGSGLTQAMFLKAGSAVIELSPSLDDSLPPSDSDLDPDSDSSRDSSNIKSHLKPKSKTNSINKIDPRYEHLTSLMEELTYHRISADSNPEQTKPIGDWKIDDVWIEEKKFLDKMIPIIDAMARKRGLI